MKKKATVKELRRLALLITKYANAHDSQGFRSARQNNWIDTYNDARAEYPEVWIEYCAKFGFVENHDAFDCMA